MISVFKKEPNEEFASPIYQAQQTTWNERYSIHIKNERQWRAAAFVSFGILALSVTGNVWQGIQSKIVPYVVERDHLGDEVALHPAEQSTPIDWRTIQYEAAQWIHDVRTVSTDMQDERHFIYSAYDRTDRNAPAGAELDRWFKDNVPWVRAKENIVTVSVMTSLPTDKSDWKTWRVLWKEDTMTRSGVLVTSQVWEAILNIIVKPPQTESEIQKNHSGFYVQNFTWEPREK
jgi:type IV secretion system protein TrbF